MQHPDPGGSAEAGLIGEQDSLVEAYPPTNRSSARVFGYPGAIVQAAGRFWPLLIAPLLLLSLLNRFPYSSATASFSDLTISHYPSALYLLQSLRQWGQIPLWSPAILGGYPFAANPLSGLWYPPGWLALILPLPFGFNLVAAMHLLWGGLGMYWFLRSQGLGHAAGLCGALAFEAMPKLFAHYGAGHLTLLYAVPWTPWLLWAWQRSLKEDNRSRLPLGDFLPGVMLGMVFLADVRWAAYAGVLWWGWAFAHSQPRNLALTLSGLVKQSLFAALLAAPLALPLLEYTRLSSRAALSAQDVLALSLPAERLVGLFIPGIQGSHEWVIYPGAVVLVLATFALLTVSPGTRRITWFWAGTAALAIFFSLGSQVPFIDNLASLPGIGLLRVPARALFLSGIALVILAGTGLERYLSGFGGGAERRVKWTLVGLNGLTFGLAFAAWRLAGRNPPGFLWGALAFLAASAWFWMGIHPHQNRSRNWLAVLLLIACFDLGGVDLQSLAGRNVESVMAEGEAAATYLRNQPGQFRIYSPSYSIPQHTAAQYDLELVDGVDPLQMASVTRFMEKASGVPQKGYSVTIPPFATGTPEVDNREYRPDPEMLGLLNVAYVVSEFDLPVNGLVLKARIGKTFVYENTFSRPRAWVQPEGERTFLASPPAGELTWTPNVISLTATGPGTLVLSEIAYPGWSVWVDGARQDVQVVDGLLRGVRLDRGEHKVVFQYLPDSLLVGLSLSGSALLFLFLRRLLGRAANPGGREKGKV